MPKLGKKSEILEGRGTAALGPVVNPPKMYQKTNLPTERAVGRSVGLALGRWVDRSPSPSPPSPLLPPAKKKVWSDRASSVCELYLVWRRLNRGGRWWELSLVCGNLV